MPVIYRYRAPSDASQPDQPEPTDADDSIVLSDLVRTGEASRLRRRVESPPVIVVGPPTWNYNGESGSLPSNPEDRAREEIAGPQTSAEARRMGSEGEAYVYTLFCGGEELVEDWDDRSCDAYEPSALPLYPQAASSKPLQTPVRKLRKVNNGCGAMVHMHTSPRRRLGVWSAKQEATDAVLPLDASYFDQAAVAKIVRSACGCVREGVGCGVCGNPLGTRYKPCQTASDGLFSPSSRQPAPFHPEGPRYWNNEPRNSPSNSNVYVYTFFSASVTSSPPYKFPSRPYVSRHSPQTSTGTDVEFEVEGVYGADRDIEDTPTYTNFDNVLTASPMAMSDMGMDENGQRVRDAPRTRGRERVGSIGMTLVMSMDDDDERNRDPDGELIDAVPNSPDKTSEMMLFPER